MAFIPKGKTRQAWDKNAMADAITAVRAQRAELAINGFRATGIYPVNRNVFHDYDFMDEDLSAVEESPNNPPCNILTSVNDYYDYCVPEAAAVEVPEVQFVNEPPSLSDYENHHAISHNQEPTTTIDDSVAGPSTSCRTYLSPKVLQPIPCLKKTVSNRGRRWAHEECAGLEDMIDFYVCEFCSND